jgi:hypothetical protein
LIVKVKEVSKHSILPRKVFCGWVDRGAYYLMTTKWCSTTDYGANSFLACRAPDVVSASRFRGRCVRWVLEVSTAGRQPQPAAPALTLAVRHQGFANPGVQNKGLEPLAARQPVRLRSPLWGQRRWWCG